MHVDSKFPTEPEFVHQRILHQQKKLLPYALKRRTWNDADNDENTCVILTMRCKQGTAFSPMRLELSEEHVN